MTVTNVPGPQFPLYLLDARVEATYPLVPLWESHGLGVALFSYDGMVSWGINADYAIMPDVGRFGDAILESFAELREAAANAPERSKKTSKPKKAAKLTKSAPKKRPPIGT